MILVAGSYLLFFVMPACTDSPHMRFQSDAIGADVFTWILQKGHGKKINHILQVVMFNMRGTLFDISRFLVTIVVIYIRAVMDQRVKQ